MKTRKNNRGDKPSSRKSGKKVYRKPVLKKHGVLSIVEGD